MNQILVTQKIYVTPELKRKKKVYKFQFFFSIVLVCLLSSYYIYAEYDRNKSEEVSRELLAAMQIPTPQEERIIEEEIEDTTIKTYDGIIVVALDDNEEDDRQIIQQPQQNPAPANTQKYTASDGVEYTIDARLVIPSLGIDYPILSDWSDELLKVSLCKYWGNDPNEVGNYCIVGHNYRSGKMFGMLPAIKNGDIIELIDTKYGRTVKYRVYDRFQIDPTDTRCTSQLTDGKKELTLITCKEYGTQRLVVKATEVL